jgi:hypothetical protein
MSNAEDAGFITASNNPTLTDVIFPRNLQLLVNIIPQLQTRRNRIITAVTKLFLH